MESGRQPGAEPPRIVCAECGSALGAGRWVAFWLEDEPPEIGTFCRACVEREFGEEVER